MPVAHDALTARIIERGGFAALQIGGFAVEGSRHGVPDIDLTHFAERYAAVKDIMAATSLPIMVDADDGYGDGTPWLSPKEFGKLGITMVLYPTTILFRATYAIEQAVRELREGNPIDKDQAVDMDEFEKIVDLPHWQKIERKFGT